MVYKFYVVFKNIYILKFIYLYFFSYKSCACVTCQRTLELEVEVTVSHRMQVLETQLRSPGKALCALKHEVIFSSSDKHTLRHAQILNDEHFLNEQIMQERLWFKTVVITKPYDSSLLFAQ